MDGALTRSLNKLFRSAELYEEQPSARREKEDVLRRLEATLGGLLKASEDAEAGGRLSEAETRLRVRVRLKTPAPSLSIPSRSWDAFVCLTLFHLFTA